MNLNQSDQWQTPDDLYKKLDDEFNFEVDLCATRDNKKTAVWSDDIQTQVIRGIFDEFQSFWMNPPYSRGNIELCMKWAIEQANMSNGILVTLTRFDPSTDWFQTYVDGVADEVRMLARRVRFVGAPSAYNFPCCVAIYNDPGRRCDWGMEDFHTKYLIWDWKE